MSKAKYRNVIMTEGPLSINLLRFALPVMMSGLLQLAFNAADIIVVGKFAGDTALAAVTSTGALVNLLVNLFTGLSMGTNVVVARALGRGDPDYVEHTVHTSVLLGVLVGLGLGAFGYVVAPMLLNVMDTPDSVMEPAALYLRVYFLGVPFSVIYNLSAAVLRGSGDTKRPMYILMMSGVLNVVLNLIFVINFHMGVAGVALATLLANLMSCVRVVQCLMQEEGMLHLDLHRLHLQPQVLGQVIRIGLPASFQAVVMALSNVVIQSSVNSFGDVVMAGAGAAGNIEGFVWVAVNAFYQACLTFTGQNLGAGKLERTDKVLARCLGMVIATGVIFGGGTWLFGPQLLGIYTDSALAIEYGMVRMTYVGLPYFLFGVMDVLVGYMRALGWSVPPMIVSLACLCGLRILWVMFIFPLDPTLPMLYLCYISSWSVATLCHAGCLVFVRARVRKSVLAEAEQTG